MFCFQAGFPMGSLGGLYTKNNYIISKGLLSDFYEFNLGADMGNYCSFTGAGNKKVSFLNIYDTFYFHTRLNLLLI